MGSQPKLKGKIVALTDKQRAQIIKMHLAGYPLRRIGERFGIDYSTISRFLKDVNAYDPTKKGGTSWD